MQGSESLIFYNFHHYYFHQWYKSILRRMLIIIIQILFLYYVVLRCLRCKSRIQNQPFWKPNFRMSTHNSTHQTTTHYTMHRTIPFYNGNNPSILRQSQTEMVLRLKGCFVHCQRKTVAYFTGLHHQPMSEHAEIRHAVSPSIE